MQYLPRDVFVPLVLVVLVGVGIFTLRRPSMGLQHELKYDGARHYATLGILGLVCGLYDGLIGPGTGTFFVIGLVALFMLFTAVRNLIRGMNLASRGQRTTGRVISANVHISGSKDNRTSTMIETIEFTTLAEPEREPVPPAQFEIAYEDDRLIVVNKPVGMVVHPAVGSTRGTLVHALLAYPGALSSIAGEDRPGIVHRLDKDTSGLIMVARNDYAHNDLSRQIRERTAGRRYLALVWGNPRFDRVRVEVPIGRHPTDRKKMTVYPAGERRPPSARDATTDLTVLERFTLPCALLEAKLKTGRTHQIRVHCSYIGHPVMGDPQYGGQRKLPVRDLELEDLIERVEGQALHAYRLSVTHPRTGAPMEFTAPLPRPYQELLDYLRAHYAEEGGVQTPLVALRR